MIDFWQKLPTSSKAGFAVGALAILGATLVGGYFLFRSDYETVLASGNPEKIAAVIREAEKLKIPYEISPDGAQVQVPAADAGRLRIGMGSGSNAGGSVGFELFNNTDFSTTEFTQRINYQRALQGELARTISGIDGVDSARVHIVMPESGFLRRQTVRPTAAVNVVMEPGAELSVSQVRGIQKLVASAIPEIKIDDIAVVDQEGIALSQSNAGEANSAHRDRLDAKRDIDTYLETKIKRVLMNIDAEGDYGVSVDATLTQDDVKVTTEDLLPVDSSGLGLKTSGVLVRERTSSKRDGGAADPAGLGASSPAGTTSRDAEYKVGRRIEQVATAPGGIERVSVAVVARMKSGESGEQNIRQLIGNAIGINEERGDTVSLVLLSPALHNDAAFVHKNSSQPTDLKALVGKQTTEVHAGPGKGASSQVVTVLAWVMAGIACLVLLGVALWRRSQEQVPSREDVDLIVDRVNQWLAQDEVSNART